MALAHHRSEPGHANLAQGVREGSKPAPTAAASTQAASGMMTGDRAAARAHRRRPLGVVLRDRRGATALVFAASAITLFGFAALATEGGSWYFTQRNARSAADMAALAGASAYWQATSGQTGAATDAATDAARRNGFASGGNTTVQVEVGSWTPPSPPYPAGSLAKPGSVRVVVERRMPAFISGLMLGEDQVAIRAAARAAIVDTGPACILSLRGDLTISGTTNVVAPECVLASNAPGKSSVNFNGSATINAKALSAAGGCFQCSKSVNPLTLPGGYATNQAPISNPFQGIDEWLNAGSRTPGSGTFPKCDNLVSPNITNDTSVYLNGAVARTICNGGTITVNGNANPALTLQDNGTYIFYNTSLNIRNGAVNCNNCTLIFTGPDANSVGTFNANANGNSQSVTNISAPKTNAFNAAFNGVAVYRDVIAAPPPGNQPSIKINGGANTRISGAIVAPSSTLHWNGNSTVSGGSSSASCGLLVAGTITLNGTSNYNLAAASGCQSSYGINAPQVTAIRLVE